MDDEEGEGGRPDEDVQGRGTEEARGDSNE